MNLLGDFYFSGIGIQQNYDKAIEFFRNLHDGDFDSFDVSMGKIEGRFGNKNTILLNFIPDFLEINEFLSWVINELRE